MHEVRVLDELPIERGASPSWTRHTSISRVLIACIARPRSSDVFLGPTNPPVVDRLSSATLGSVGFPTCVVTAQVENLCYRDAAGFRHRLTTCATGCGIAGLQPTAAWRNEKPRRQRPAGGVSLTWLIEGRWSGPWSELPCLRLRGSGRWPASAADGGGRRGRLRRRCRHRQGSWCRAPVRR